MSNVEPVVPCAEPRRASDAPMKAGGAAAVLGAAGEGDHDDSLSVCSTHAPGGAHCNMCALCEDQRGWFFAVLPDTPENRAQAKRTQHPEYKVSAHEGTLQAIVCAQCKANLAAIDEEVQRQSDEEDAQQLAAAIQRSIDDAGGEKTELLEDHYDRDLEEALSQSTAPDSVHKNHDDSNYDRDLEEALRQSTAPDPAHEKCASPGCERLSEYAPGCEWDRCCKQGFIHDCLMHDRECDARAAAKS